MDSANSITLYVCCVYFYAMIRAGRLRVQQCVAKDGNKAKGKGKKQAKKCNGLKRQMLKQNIPLAQYLKEHPWYARMCHAEVADETRQPTGTERRCSSRYASCGHPKLFISDESVFSKRFDSITVNNVCNDDQNPTLKRLRSQYIEGQNNYGGQ